MKTPRVQVYRCPYKGTLMCPQCTPAWSDAVEVLVTGCNLGPLRNAKDDSVICDLFVDLEAPGVHETIQKAGTFLRLVGTEGEGDV